MKGYIYVLSNPAYPKCVKIGKSRDPKARVKQLSGSTGVLYKFKIQACFKSLDYTTDEQRAHQALDCYRVKNNKEFFRINPEEAIYKLTELLGVPVFSLLEYKLVLENKLNEKQKEEEKRMQDLREYKKRRAKEAELFKARRKKEDRIFWIGLSVVLGCLALMVVGVLI